MNGWDEKFIQHSAPRILKKMHRQKVNIAMAVEEVKSVDLSLYWTRMAQPGGPVVQYCK
jgi:hypothetical protein